MGKLLLSEEERSSSYIGKSKYSYTCFIGVSIILVTIVFILIGSSSRASKIQKTFEVHVECLFSQLVPCPIFVSIIVVVSMLFLSSLEDPKLTIHFALIFLGDDSK